MENTPARIHLIDDDPHSLEVLKFILHKKGYETQMSLSGADALECFEQYKPDLILLDILMPEMDGYEVCHLLKQKEELKDIPVIFITASHQTKELVKGFDAGAVDFISKPINKPELLARVQTHLDLKQSRDMLAAANRELQEEIGYRKQAEERFKALSETSFEAVMFVYNHQIVEANKAAGGLLGIAGEKLPVAMDNLVAPENRILLHRILQSKDQGPWEIELLDARGNAFYGLVQHMPVSYKGQLMSVLAVRDISWQKEHEKEILNAIVETQENERKRFSRDLHDGLGAILSTLKIYIGLLQKEGKTDEEKKNLLAEMKETIQYAVDAARTIANNIMPSLLMDHGVVKALRSFVAALNKTQTLEVSFDCPDELMGLSASSQTHLYRIVLELINNTLKHSGAQKVQLEIQQLDGVITIRYHDNGKGFDFENIYARKEGGQGLKNIISRVNFLNGKGGYQNYQPGKMEFYLEIPT
ncbi:MAG: response regulator [Bacteroidales bacterium]